MTTMEVAAPLGSADPKRRSSMPRAWAWALAALGMAAVVAIAWNARNYPDARIGNPQVNGVPRPVEPLFGFDHWLTLLQVFSIVADLALIVVFIVGWRRRPAHPYLLMGLVTTMIVWQDPIMNWAPYAVYNPRLWHFPESWPLVSMSPTIEPFVVIGYVMFQFGPALLGIWLLRKVQARKPVDSFAWRHPLITLGAVVLVVGFIIDMVLEVTLVRTEMYTYSQVIPFGSIFTGTAHQFPLLWESIGVTVVMIPAGVLVYRDDTGRSMAEKLAQRSRVLARRPALGTFVVMFLIVNVAYFAYGAGFLAIKMSKAATSVACPWPYPDAKVYDPQGFYEKNGQAGPYSVGMWSTWMNGQPDGRPDVQLPADGGRCGDGG